MTSQKKSGVPLDQGDAANRMGRAIGPTVHPAGLTALADVLVELLAEPIARRVVDLLRDGHEIDLVDQRDSPLGSRRHVSLCRSGALPHVRLGRRWCVRRDDLDRYLHGAGPTVPAPAPSAEGDLDEIAAELGLRVLPGGK